MNIKVLVQILFFTLLFSKISQAAEFGSVEEINTEIPFIENISKYKSQLNNYYKSKNKRQININLHSSFEEYLPLNFHNKVNLGELIEGKIDTNDLDINKEDTRLSVKEFISENPKYIYALDKFLRGPKTSVDSYTLQKSDVLLEAFNTFSIFPNIEKINGGRNISKILLPITLAVAINENFLEEDDSCEGSITLTASATSIDEDAGTSLTLTATLDKAASKDIVLNISTSGTATEGTDYGTISDITISAGNTTGTTSFTPTDDNIAENPSELISPSESATISMTSTAKQCLSGSPTILINDDEANPVITLTTSATSIAENSGSSLTLTATSTIISSSDIVVSISTEGVAIEGTDYATISDITISAGSTTGTTSFTPTDDSIYETSTNETAIVHISDVNGGGAAESTTEQKVTITITENDSAPTVTLAGSASSIAENAGSSVTLTATLSNATSEDVTVTIGTSGAATEGTDYATISNISISAGDTTGTANFTPTNDSTYEGNEAAAVAITAVSGGSATESGTQSVSITITDDESAPTVTLSAASSSIVENSGSAIVLTATLSSATTADVTVSISTSGTGTEGSDYATISDITISAGDTTGTANFTPTNDSGSEGSETAIIAISGVSGGSASESGTQSVTITIIDDESVPKATLAVSASSINENAGSSLTITATISSTSSEDITVSISTSGAATEGTDYATISDITISAGDTTGTASFTPTDDSVYEDDEAAAVAISGVSGGNAIEDGTQSVSITISENESAPTVTLATSASSIAENAGSSLTLTATASGAADEDITVSITPTGTGTEGTDYSTISDITISAGYTTGTVSFTPTNDSTYEGSETAIVAITGVSGGGASESGTQSTTITITDDESAPTVTLSAASSSIVENSGSAIVLTATLSSATTADVTVSISTSGAASEGSDYATISDITISAGSTTGTANFTPTNDSTSEGTEAAVIAISGVSGGSASESGTQSVSINIIDDESAAAATLTISSSSIAENSSSTLTLTATLSSTDSEDVTVTLASSGGTEGTDYENLSTITISAGSTTGTTTFDPKDDSIYEGDEAITITIASVSGGTAIENGNQSLTATITENESAPTVSLATSATTVYDSGLDLTLTATSTQAADEAITVSFSVSGTATSGSDYTALSNITIAAGQTEGTTTFNPTAPSTYEATETATITISNGTLSGADATVSGNASVSINITQYFTNITTAFSEDTNYNSTVTGWEEYSNVEYSGNSGRLHPYTQMNLHKALSYKSGSTYLSGAGETIAVVDSYCDKNHAEFDGKTVRNYGTFATDSSDDHHCNAVAAFAAGEYDDATDSNSIMGVAFGADLHLSDWSGSTATNETYFSEFLKDTTAHADDNYEAIVQNNSWGYGLNATEMATWMAGYTNTDEELHAYIMNGSAVFGSASTQSFTDYIAELDDFQDHGAIVFSLGNDANESDASWTAALPYWYSELGEAWISVGVYENTGSSLSADTITRKGNPCGTTASYCLFLDGWQVSFASEHTGSGSTYDDGGNNYGSSWTAPMVSGSIALLAQAFPNHTPAQLVDRLLASANNTWLTHSAAVEFINGVEHGYNTEFGHGTPDLSAAMQPITSSKYSTGSYVGNSNSNNINDLTVNPLGSSVLSTSSSFGDAITNSAIINETTYVYDALNGGFAIPVNEAFHLVSKSEQKNKYNFNRDFARLNNFQNKINFKQQNDQFNGLLPFSEGSRSGITIESASASLQSFNQFNSEQNFYLKSKPNPFTEKTKGIGINTNLNFGKAGVILSYQNSEISPNQKGNTETETYSATLNFVNSEGNQLSIITGMLKEKDTFLFSKGSGALNYNNAKPESYFSGVNFGHKFNEDMSLSFTGTLGQSKMENSQGSLIDGTSHVLSSSFNSTFNMYNNFKKGDRLSFSISQPHKLETGHMNLRIPKLADSEGNLNYESTSISLSPSGRQIDVALDYVTSITDNFNIGIKTTINNNYNHIESDKINGTIALSSALSW